MNLRLLVASLLAAGCTSPRTEVILGVATDLSATDMIDTVKLTATRDGVPVLDQTWDISGLPAMPTELPGSFGIYSSDGSEPRVEVAVTAYHGAKVVVQRQSLFSLVKEETLFLRLGLASPCQNVTCQSDQTCVEGTCKARMIDAHRLPHYLPDMEKFVQCSSGVVYKDTSTKQPMPTMGSGSCGANQECSEATCYDLPGGVGVPDLSVPGDGGGGDGPVDGGSASPASVVDVYAGVPSAAMNIDGPNATAGFSTALAGIKLDPSGVLYAAQTDGYIRRIDATTTSTIAGDGKFGFKEGPALQAEFVVPADVQPDGAGNLFIADSGNHRIRILSGGQVSTFSGSGTTGVMDGPPGTAQFGLPYGLAYDPAAKILYVADRSNNTIRTVDASGNVTTLAGNGTGSSIDGLGLAASFAAPSTIAFDPLGMRLLVIDQGSCDLRSVSTIDGNTFTLAGTGMCAYADGTGRDGGTASFAGPSGVAVDKRYAWVADSSVFVVRRVNLVSGDTITYAGNGMFGLVNGLPQASEFTTLWGLSVLDGTLFVADTGNTVIREVQLIEDMTGPWAFSMDSGGSAIPSMAIDSSDFAHVTATSVGADGSQCGCNSEQLRVPLNGTFDCATSTVQFDYHTEGAFGFTSTSSVQIDFQFSDLGNVGSFQGSEQTGHSNCAGSFSGSSFPAQAQLREGANKIVPASLDPALNGTACQGSFDTVVIHLQAYGCFATDTSKSTITNFKVY